MKTPFISKNLYLINGYNEFLNTTQYIDLFISDYCNLNNTLLDIHKIKLFISKIEFKDIDSCWEWQYSLDKNGYGHFVLKNKSINNTNVTMGRAHRVMYGFIFNQELKTDTFVCHDCDNPKCCNPNHLWIGTTKDNMADMVSKHRSSKRFGEEHHLSVLTNLQARSIFMDIRPQHAIAKDYNITQPTVSAIKLKKLYEIATRDLNIEDYSIDNRKNILKILDLIE